MEAEQLEAILTDLRAAREKMRAYPNQGDIVFGISALSEPIEYVEELLHDIRGDA